MKFFRLFWASVRIVYAAAPGLFFARILILLVSSVSGLWMMYSTQQLFLCIEEPGQDGSAMVCFCLFAAAFLFRVASGSVYDYFSIMVSERYNTAFQKMFHEKSGRIAAADFERSELSDLLEGAGMGIYGMEYFVSDILGIIFYDVPYLVMVGGYLFWISPMLLFAPVVIFIPVIVTLLLKAGDHMKYRDELANLKRRGKHYREAVSAPAFMKETRSFGCYHFFLGKYRDNLELEQGKEWKVEFYSQTKELFSKLVTLGGYAAVLYLLYAGLGRGEISIGTFSAVFYGIVQLYNTMEQLVLGKFKNIIVQDYAAIGNFVRFMEYPERRYGKTDLADWDQIELKHVSFHYESREENALTDVSLTIKKGETLAIVGENGSGKSTLAKLILGLYLPCEGEVSYGGTKVQELSEKTVYKNKTAIFQNFIRYLFRLDRNVRISDLKKEDCEAELKTALEQADVKYDSPIYPQGVHTMLSKQFGGVDLSGGEWQRVAIARGLFRRYNLIVLDEPTAAIDPIEEGRLYRKFSEITKDATAVIITHRLGSVKMADRILVMEKGRVVQTGTHESLKNEEGCYRRLYQAQAQWYE